MQLFFKLLVSNFTYGILLTLLISSTVLAERPKADAFINDWTTKSLKDFEAYFEIKSQLNIREDDALPVYIAIYGDSEDFKKEVLANAQGLLNQNRSSRIYLAKDNDGNSDTSKVTLKIGYGFSRSVTARKDTGVEVLKADLLDVFTTVSSEFHEIETGLIARKPIYTKTESLPIKGNRPVVQCDELAAWKYDDKKLVVGIAAKDIDTALAKQVCEKAINDYPNDTTLLYQYARILYFHGSYDGIFSLTNNKSLMEYPPFLYLLGTINQLGKGVPVDKRKACGFYNQAAQRGLSVAMMSVAYCFAVGDYGPINRANALAWYEKAALDGVPEANYAVGIFTQFRLPKNYIREYDDKAAYYFKKAASLGIEKAGDRYKMLVKQGHTGEKTSKAVASVLKANIKIKKLQTIADRGDANAQVELAEFLMKRSSPKMMSGRAFKLLKKAAKQEQPRALYLIGKKYSGKEAAVGHRSMGEAWLLRSGKAGNIDAYKTLASIYDLSYGARRGDQKAFAAEYRLIAANAGDKEEMRRLARYYENKRFILDHQELAAQWYLKLAKKGDVEAQYEMSGRYRTGLGVKESLLDFSDWFNISAKNGHPGAITYLCYLHVNFLYKGEYKADPTVKCQDAINRGEKTKGAYSLAFATAIGWKNKKPDVKSAVKQMEAIADSYSPAKETLFQWYHFGIYVKKNKSKARHWVQEAYKSSSSFPTILGMMCNDDLMMEYCIMLSDEEKEDGRALSDYLIKEQGQDARNRIIRTSGYLEHGARAKHLMPGYREVKKNPFALDNLIENESLRSIIKGLIK